MVRRFLWARLDVSQSGYNRRDGDARAVLAPNVAMMTFFRQGASSVQP